MLSIKRGSEFSLAVELTGVADVDFLIDEQLVNENTTAIKYNSSFTDGFILRFEDLLS